jgi:hypothetical protein
MAMAQRQRRWHHWVRKCAAQLSDIVRPVVPVHHHIISVSALQAQAPRSAARALLYWSPPPTRTPLCQVLIITSGAQIFPE